MRRSILTLAAWAALSLSGWAQDWATIEGCTVETPEIVEAALAPYGLDNLRDDAAQIANSKGRFWQITSSAGGLSYLWGTMHSNDRHALDLPKRVVQDIEAARIVAVEIDYRYPTRAAYREGQQNEHWWLQRPLPLSDRGLDPDIAAALETRLLDSGVAANAIPYLTRGGLVSFALSDPCDDFNAGTIPLQDDRILMLGLIAGATGVGLEPPKALFHRLAEDKALARAILSLYGAYLEPVTPDQLNAARSTQMALYLRGELGVSLTWEAAWLKDRFGAEEGMDHLKRTDAYLVIERNRDFLDRIMDDLKTGGVFMAIGFGHLPGEGGMVEMLRAEGFDVSRIVLPGEVE
ncbi:TraB/GumN family protein [Thalassococcus sp. S3]|uniref:TraB/GumN family protein n=1 Tax=Thalassococcus sp. S3 TaxID=2017482 RepID=UPI0010242D96|nr:TraB/GumN family protein [Thalassococcus sp. S3]QBF33500.1 hypothetical protein CFI11_20130 [Thalassococcus sp. S3]